MLVGSQHYRSIWVEGENPQVIKIIDQRWLPHRFELEDIETVEEMAIAIRDMHLRGAGLIGAAAAYGIYLACLKIDDPSLIPTRLEEAAQLLFDTRPTAVNLAWALDRQKKRLAAVNSLSALRRIALTTAQQIAEEDIARCKAIGRHGLTLLREISKAKGGEPINILTHCNAGWLAFVDYGTATAPIYAAVAEGIPVHVWVDETRPRNQGARLTAWELGQQQVPHTVIADNVGGHLMQHGLVDLVITGSDRTGRNGDVANKIGTYLKALAAHDNGIPFYVALPSSTLDWEVDHGLSDIPIEERDPNEVKFIAGLMDDQITKVLLTPEQSSAANYAFDVTPARLITGLITERGICAANEASITAMFRDLDGS